MFNFEVCAYLVNIKSKIPHFERGTFFKGLARYSYRLQTKMSTNEKLPNNYHNSSPSNRTKSYNTCMPWDELGNLKAIAEPWVKKCIVRF